MKKTIALFLALSVLFAFCSCGKESEVPSGTKLVESDFIDCSFYVPEDWTVSTAAGFASANDSEGRSVSITAVSPEGEYDSIEDYYRNYYVKTLKDTFTSVELTEEYTENEFLGKDTYACKYVLSLSLGDTDYTVLQVVAGHSYYLYIFTYFAPAALYEEELDTVYDLISYFSF